MSASPSDPLPDWTECFHPLIVRWFAERFGEPTEPQRLGWPVIAAGRNTLIAAPTGSGKTLAAFLVCLDRLLRQWLDGQLHDGVQVVYVSPLKALSNDIERNLHGPLSELQELVRSEGRTGCKPVLPCTPPSSELQQVARSEGRTGWKPVLPCTQSPSQLRELQRSEGLGPLPIRVAVRTGDTPARDRQAMVRRPPHILVTTPESLYLVLTSAKSRDIIRGVRTVIVDEIHALARDKRGSHLALSLERLAALCDRPPTRIGLSATQRPIDQIAEFLVGAPPDCVIIDTGHIRQLDLAIEVPAGELSAVCSHERWGEIYKMLIDQIESHRSTLIFVNTRRLAERVAHHLREALGERAAAAHHGSLSRAIRLSVEQRLKCGELKAIVATASLEMGIDIGYIDLVCQVGSPRSIATFLQRIGRSGHALGRIPKGRLLPLTRDELLECMALIRAVRRGRLDQIEIPRAPLDILAQQIVAAVACDQWQVESLYALCRRAWPYRDLSWEDFQEVVRLLAEGIAPGLRRGAYMHYDRVHGRLRARRGARLAALTSGGAIPETAEYRVVTEEEKTLVGTVDEDFAVETMAGDVFLLGNTSWRVRYVRGGDVVVRDAEGAAPSIPFWFGEAPGRTMELSQEVSHLRRDVSLALLSIGKSVEGWVDNPQSKAVPHEGPVAHGGAVVHGHSAQQAQTDGLPDIDRTIVEWLGDECGAPLWAAEQAARYVAAQLSAIGCVPTCEAIVFERFFDESGGMQLVIHSPLGARINRAWGLALRKRFCRTFDFELQAAATDNGIVLSLSPQHSFPLDQMFRMLTSHNAQPLLEQAVPAVPMFRVRWRWNVTRSLAVLRMQGGKKVPPYLQRFRSDDLLAAVFPETVGCLENHQGDIRIPDHPLVRQTMRDCLYEAMDVGGWLELLGAVESGQVKLIPCDTREPSPFSHELLNANPYAFLDGAPLEERRTRAVRARRTLAPEDFRDLARLDPQAIDQVRGEAWPTVRDSDELHDALLSMIMVRECDAEPWHEWFEQLLRDGRATRVRIPSCDLGSDPRPSLPSALEHDARQWQTDYMFWVAAERWPLVRSVYPEADAVPAVPALAEPMGAQNGTPAEGRAELIRGRLEHVGPVTESALWSYFQQRPDDVRMALEILESRGVVMRGHFTPSEPQAVRGQETRAQRGFPIVAQAAREVAARTEDERAAQRQRNEQSQVEWCDERSQVEWCDRRLLARIHRLTLDGLRRRIQPVEPAVFLRFLARHQHLVRDSLWGGPVGTREVVGLLQGLELPAGVWERYLLAARIADYDPAWLDQLFLSGEVTWGRLAVPQRGRDGRLIRLTRAVPISLVLREDLPWVLPADGRCTDERIRSQARDVLDALATRGALFFQELTATLELLPAQLEELLRELAGMGLVTCDSFAAVRQAVDPTGARRRLRHGRRGADRMRSAPAGRWSRFPGSAGAVSRHQRLESWARQLLRRYGVVFRDLAARESAAPDWWELVAVLRRLELRGEVRGGRFVARVAGEQFATEGAVERLRQTRDESPHHDWLVISAADPLNLTGILTDGPRVPAAHGNTLILSSGQYIAARQNRQIEFFHQVPKLVEQEMRRALQTGRRSRYESTGGLFSMHGPEVMGSSGV